MMDTTDIKLIAECAVGFDDVSLAPDVVLALVAEIEALSHWRDLALQFDNHRMAALWHLKRLVVDQQSQSCAELFLRDPPMAAHEVVAERDQLKAENEALRKDKDRLDALESNFWDVRHNSHPIADTGDSSSSLEIVGHWMDKPFERVIGEDYNENLRAAIDQAMKAPAYPPARPEYEFDEIPDFGGGSGNKARRRAELLGIDYEAASKKADQ